jgi:hypothetical protein
LLKINYGLPFCYQNATSDQYVYFAVLPLFFYKPLRLNWNRTSDVR